MRKLLARRRVLASLVGSLLLHAIVLAGWPEDPRRQLTRRDSSAISVEVLRISEPASRVVAMAGERPSGRGHALAGSNPSKAGSPRHAARTQAASGRAVGPGSEGAPAEQPVPPAAPPVTEPVLATARDLPPTVQADDLFDRLAREQRMRLASGNGGGLAGFGDGEGGTGLGLRTELSGRHVEGSHVTSPPVAIRAPPVECALADHLRLEATVRVLVRRNGEAAVPRLSLSSGDGGFDACAVRYVLGMRFSPGVDAGGHSLDVWMDVRITPLAAGQILGAP